MSAKAIRCLTRGCPRKWPPLPPRPATGRGWLVVLSMDERRAVTKEMARRYRKAPKGEKVRMLQELCALTGWSRRHARRALRQAEGGGPAPPRPPRRGV